ncbi:hypothetical protein NDU88_001937 [Pleurodeles waltl]|uniref:Uncharacterized protein n=1 Tax=Pleurodeles waltl TaxID=8319 RepID=A0AAV7S905_PLEWA|nr:hypothetical protein NDU88_001937 [Pleurodeles waltl]
MSRAAGDINGLYALVPGARPSALGSLASLWRPARPKSKPGEEEMSPAAGDGNALYALVPGARPLRSGFSGVSLVSPI